MKSITIFFAAVAIIATGCGGSDTPAAPAPDSVEAADWDVQGHRGARGVRPENTLPAFESALDVGVSTLELDLHLSADGVLVIWHDPRIEAEKCRDTDPELPSVTLEPLVNSLTATQLATYVCDQNPDPGKYPDQTADAGTITGSNYVIATLEQLFEMVNEYSESESVTEEQRANAATVLFNVELKRDPSNPDNIGDSFDGTNPAAFETAVVDLVAAWGYEDRVIVQSFDHRSLWALHTLEPSIRLAALTSRDIPDLDELAAAGASIWSPRYTLLAADVLAEAAAAGLAVIPWTVNDEGDVCSLLELGTDGVITDRPDLVLGPNGWLAGCS
ncbi:MAG: hypothetical protein GY788_19230 [bacterium]|nr:hypothetical protein [bacterium]